MVSLSFSGCGGTDDELSSDEREQIASTLEGFIEAFGNADGAALESYWSDACSAADRQEAALGAMGMNAVITAGGQGPFDLEVDATVLNIEGHGDEVTVPLEQPEAAVSATVTINEQVAPVFEPLLVEVPVQLRRENGEWRIASCTTVAEEDPDEETEEAIPTPA